MNVKISITTVGGDSKLVFNGLVLGYLNKQDLECLSFDIWVAQMEMSLAQEIAQKYEEAV